MARIDLPKRPPWWIRLIFFVARKQYGKTVAPLQMAAHVPGFVVPFMMTNLFAHGRRTLPPDTRLLAMHLVGELNQCNWCIDFARSLAHGTAMQDNKARVARVGTAPGILPRRTRRAALCVRSDPGPGCGVGRNVHGAAPPLFREADRRAQLRGRARARLQPRQRAARGGSGGILRDRPRIQRNKSFTTDLTD